MSKNTQPNPHVDGFIKRSENWGPEFEQLRAIIQQTELNEEFKWGHPCYTVGKTNLVLMQGFKDACALQFNNGALLKDPKKILEMPGPNSQAARRIKFTSVDEIKKLAPLLKRYLEEAIKAEKAGLKVEFKETSEFDFPEEFQNKLDEMPALKEAFEALTPGRQRGYLLHFSSAKQSSTRTARVEKHIDRILDGLGLND